MIRIRQIKIKVEEDSTEKLKEKVATKLKIKKSDICTLKINKRSIDARRKTEIYFVYEVDVRVINEKSILKKQNNKDIFLTPDEEYYFPKRGTKLLNTRPIIVGSGPAGLFCAYFLALYGYKPLIIERGEPIELRVKTVENFFKTNQLNLESNVQFGEGGAGTFSDGKLNTLVKDNGFRQKKLFEILVEAGAPRDITYLNKPHIGTDLLRKVIINLRNKIIQMGGEFLYNSCLTDFTIKNNQVVEIELNKKQKLPCEILVLAIGNSARDTFELLHHKNIKIKAKPFAVGLRIEHPQKLIDQAQYGANKILNRASYKLVYQSTEKRGVYSFCMCPGGYVINASSEENRLAVNGMSNYDRASLNANSAIVVTVSDKDFGSYPLAGINYQRQLEERAYKLGQGKIPIQLYKDYKNNKISNSFGQIKPVFKGRYTFANLNEIFPDYINKSLKEAIEYFATKIEGFNKDDVILAGVESRTSSPIRIERDANFMSNIKGIYPCGEGSGYAGGITTSAIDGMKISEAIAKIYSPK